MALSAVQFVFSGGRIVPSARKTELRTCQAGVSYLETVLVFVLVSIVLGIGLPSYRNYTSNQRALVAARTLASDLRVAQQEAVTRRADITVSFSAADAACANAPSYVIA